MKNIRAYLYDSNSQTEWVLKNMIDLQTQAYQRVPQILASGDILLLSQFGSSRAEILSTCKRLVETYTEIYLNPCLVALLPDMELATLRHILFKMEDEWNSTHPEGVRNAWEILFYIDTKRHPEIEVTLELLER